MSETTTVVIVAVAAVGLFLLWTQIQQQQQVTNALLVRAAQPQQAPSNPLAAIAPLVGPILGAVL